MSKQRKRYTPKKYESRKPNGDISANIYLSMIQSKAWRELTPNAMRLYLYMKLQLYGQKSLTDCGEEYFYFNKAMWHDTYHIYTNQAQFYKDRDMLVSNGFIEIVERGQNTRTRAIYKFSDKWQKVT